MPPLVLNFLQCFLATQAQAVTASLYSKLKHHHPHCHSCFGSIRWLGDGALYKNRIVLNALISQVKSSELVTGTSLDFHSLVLAVHFH